MVPLLRNGMPAAPSAALAAGDRPRLPAGKPSVLRFFPLAVPIVPPDPAGVCGLPVAPDQQCPPRQAQEAGGPCGRPFPLPRTASPGELRSPSAAPGGLGNPARQVCLSSQAWGEGQGETPASFLVPGEWGGAVLQPALLFLEVRVWF